MARDTRAIEHFRPDTLRDLIRFLMVKVSVLDYTLRGEPPGRREYLDRIAIQFQGNQGRQNAVAREQAFSKHRAPNG